ncbi:MAG: hypothetical protein K2G13_04745, partial [Muribaculaceae bacterium]|nr:hypothetical protein [Muribaculaceae bacterium]
MKQNVMSATCKKAPRAAANIVFLMIFLVLSAFETSALSDVTVRLYNQREIIASNYTALCQDQEGFIWVGSETGLNRFDGNKCDLYRNNELDEGSISDNKIVSLYCDSRGNMWVGTVNGLNYYDPYSDSFRLVSLPGQSLNGFITDITEFPDGKLAFLVAGIGIYTLDVKNIGAGINKPEGSRFSFDFNNDNEISRIAGLNNKGTVFSTRSGEVFLLSKGGNVKRLAKINGNVTNLCVENPNSLVIATQYEAFRVGVNDASIFPLVFDSNETIKIKGIYSDGKTTYFATANDGVWSVKAGDNAIRRAEDLHSSTMDLSSLKVGCIYIDRTGNIWFGCGHKGLAVASSHKSSFLKKSLNEILRKERGAEVTCMAVLVNEIVIGLNNGVVLFLNVDGSVRKLNISQGAPVTSLCAYSGGRVLVGVAREGIWCVDQS